MATAAYLLSMTLWKYALVCEGQGVILNGVSWWVQLGDCRPNGEMYDGNGNEK